MRIKPGPIGSTMPLQQRFAFIGGGVMASAIVRSMLVAGVLEPDQVSVSDPSESSRAAAESLGVRTGGSNGEAVRGADVIILAVKPHVVPLVLQEIASGLTPEQLVVSIAAGVTLGQ